MTRRLLRYVTLLAGLLLASSWLVGAKDLSFPHPSSASSFSLRTLVTGERQVNAPHGVPRGQAAIFWFGRVTPDENYVDVRVGYRDNYLYVHLAVFDRLLWYDKSPSPDDLTAWDAATLYLDTDGNVGDAPDSNAYRFDAQLVWWEPRDDYQAAYRGDGSGWVTATVPFTTTSGWRGTAPNNEEDDRGWALTYYVPFESLGASRPPTQGTVWGMAVALHDRDDEGGTPIADKVWPEAMEPARPATWGRLAFGIPTYSPQPAVPGGTLAVRHGLDGTIVVDADVGGSSVCGGPAAPDYFPTWGELNYVGKEFLNVQNLGDVGDWPCLSKYYVTFPLDVLPAGKVIISATLTLFQFGNAGEGWDPGPEPSLIQVLTVDQDWDENTLTWNNAPLAVENVSAAWVDPLDSTPDWPGVPREWDVSGAVANAYAAGEPLRLALYEADWAYHSGKYFFSSDIGGSSGEGRPTLTVTWGRAVAEVEKTAAPAFGDQGSSVTYTLDFLGTDNTLTLTDTLPIGVRWDDNLDWDGTGAAPTYDSDHHRLTWSGAPSLSQQVLITYTATITTSDRQALVNTAELSEVGGETCAATVIVIANPHQNYLPVILKDV